MKIDSLEFRELIHGVTGDRLVSILREQGRRLEAQKKALSSLNRIKERDVENTRVFEAFRFFLLVLFNKVKLW